MKDLHPFSLESIVKIKDDEIKCRELLEQVRWNGEPCCPKCGGLKPYKITSKPTSKYKVRDGLYKCRECRKPFTVTVGTVFEDGHIKLGTWFMAFALLSSSKKGMSAHQLHRMLGITYKTSWYMCHRIRFAMQKEEFAKFTGVVEIDEVYIGGKKKGWRSRQPAPKMPVISLVERGGDVRSFPVENATAKAVRALIHEHTQKDVKIITDGSSIYDHLDKQGYKDHEIINHAAYEYVRGHVYTNTVEGYFSLLKRGIVGVYHHVSYAHLMRYLSEFDFRYSNRKIEDSFRTLLALKGFEGKRLTYKRTSR